MDIINIISLGAISIQAMLVVVFVILNKMGKRQDSNKLSEPDNPLLLTIQAMEDELIELNKNNIHMERIAQLEKDIKEAHKHAEALSKVAGNYGNTIEEVGESIVGGLGGRNVIHTVKPVDSNGIVVGGINTIHNAFDDTKPDWKGYVNSLRCNLDLMGGSVLPDSITEGMSLSEYKKFYDFIYEHKALGIGRQFNNKATYSIKTLVSHLSLEDFRNPEAYANEVYDLLLRDKQSYEVYTKVFEEEVFDFEEFRQAVLSYFKEREEVFDEKLTRQNTAIYRTYTSSTGWSTYYDVNLK